MPMPKKPRMCCFNCGLVVARASYKYCSNQCQTDYQYRTYIKGWQEGTILGLQRLGVVSRHIKRYLRETFNDKCCLCGWSVVNRVTGVVPLVADHIDGNWRNNAEQNLRLICPNCDSLSETYAGLNRGLGRKDRTISRRIQLSRQLTSEVENTAK